MKFIPFLFVILLCASNLAAQDETIFDKTSIKLTGAWGGPQIAITGYKGDIAFQSGGFAELEFNKEFFIGWQNYNIELPIEQLNNPDFSFNGFTLGYIPMAGQSIHPKVSVLLGPGRIERNALTDQDDNVFVIQPSGGVEINIFRWFRLNANLGYRFVSDSDISIIDNADLTSLYGELKFKFGYSWGR